MLLALALGDENVGGAEAADLADRALLMAQQRSLDPPAALEAPKTDSPELGLALARRPRGEGRKADRSEVELVGLEPTTSAMPWQRSPS